MSYDYWIDKITADDIENEDLRFVAEAAGLRYALMLMFLLPGLTINIPKYAFRKIKEKYILKHYDGTRNSLNKLAIECEFSQRHVYRLLKKNLRELPKK